jgi:hypothetical protein
MEDTKSETRVMNRTFAIVLGASTVLTAFIAA